VKILIFGVSGNSGRAVAEYFLKKGHEVTGVGRRQNFVGCEGLAYVRGDITDKSWFSILPSNFDMVINFAGVQPSIMETSESTDLYATLRQYVDVNIVGTFNVLEWVSKQAIKTYIYATTHRDYEKYWVQNKPLENNWPPAINYDGDHSMYAISKVVGQMMGDYLIPLKGVRCFNLRLPMIFMVPDSPYYLANGTPTIMPFLKIIRAAMQGEALEIWGDPKMPRDYVYIDNLISLIEKCEKSTLGGGTFSVGTGEGVSTEKFVKTIADVFAPQASDIKFIYKPERRTYKSAVYDISEQNTLLGYEPVLLEEMLRRMKAKIDRGNYFEKWGW
jgi:UDP-glucose 4-epimerase